MQVINPRKILLHRIQQMLDKLQYRMAFLEMRRHRLTFNLIYNHNPQVRVII